MLPVSSAIERILMRVSRGIPETVPLADSAGRVLADDIVAQRALPPFDNSAMDGIALRATDAPGPLPITGTQSAGSSPDAELAAASAVRIMTGAPVPRGADAVVPREELDDDGDSVLVKAPVRAGQHIRSRGEDIAIGATAIPAGTRIGPGAIGALASLGAATVVVRARPVVGIVSTGSELVPLGREPGPGQIISSNNLILAEQVRRAGGIPRDLGIAVDTLDEVRSCIEAALECDFVVTSGGVSVGDFDYVRQALDDLEIPLDFWRVAMKPGKPVAFGVHPGGALFFGLPGNPVSTFVSFELFVRPAILAYQGASECFRPRLTAEITTDVAKPPGRAHYLRASLQSDGRRVTPKKKQGSGMLSTLLSFDSLVELPADSAGVRTGEPVTILYLGGET